MNTIAIFPGSFDPIHRGHLSVLKRAVAIFPTVIWAIGVNISKIPMFSLEDRLEMMKSVNSFPNVEIVSFSGLLADYAVEREATHIIRSLRSATDFDYENQIEQVNERLAPGIETIYFPAKHQYAHLSSSMVRELLKYQKILPGSLPVEVETQLQIRANT